MFHANGWSYTWGMAATGATNICLRKFDGPIIIDFIKKHGVTHMCGAPVVLNMLTNSPNNEKLQNLFDKINPNPSFEGTPRTKSMQYVTNVSKEEEDMRRMKRLRKEVD